MLWVWFGTMTPSYYATLCEMLYSLCSCQHWVWSIPRQDQYFRRKRRLTAVVKILGFGLSLRMVWTPILAAVLQPERRLSLEEDSAGAVQ